MKRDNDDDWCVQQIKRDNDDNRSTWGAVQMKRGDVYDNDHEVNGCIVFEKTDNFPQNFADLQKLTRVRCSKFQEPLTSLRNSKQHPTFLTSFHSDQFLIKYLPLSKGLWIRFAVYHPSDIIQSFPNGTLSSQLPLSPLLHKHQHGPTTSSFNNKLKISYLSAFLAPSLTRASQGWLAWLRPGSAVAKQLEQSLKHYNSKTDDY